MYDTINYKVKDLIQISPLVTLAELPKLSDLLTCFDTHNKNYDWSNENRKIYPYFVRPIFNNVKKIRSRELLYDCSVDNNNWQKNAWRDVCLMKIWKSGYNFLTTPSRSLPAPTINRPNKRWIGIAYYYLRSIGKYIYQGEFYIKEGKYFITFGLRTFGTELA